MSLDCTCNRLREAEAKAAKWDALVRCGECEFARYAGTKCYRVMTRDIFENAVPARVNPDGFCAWGERREA